MLGRVARWWGLYGGVALPSATLSVSSSWKRAASLLVVLRSLVSLETSFWKRRRDGSRGRKSYGELAVALATLDGVVTSC